MPQVFGCPHCQNPFQVPDDAAGQTFQCPSCNTPVEVPAEGAHAREQSATEPEIFECPHCSGQFGIDASMYGQQLSCPHCNNVVAIGEAPEDFVSAPVIETDDAVVFEEETPKIDSQSSQENEPAQELTDKESVEVEQTERDSKQTTEYGSPKSTAGLEESQTEPTASDTEAEPEPEPVFEKQSVDHLLPPTFNVPDPVRFPARLDS